MYESVSKINELENEMTLDMSYFWYSDVGKLANTAKICLYKDHEGDFVRFARQCRGQQCLAETKNLPDRKSVV